VAETNGAIYGIVSEEGSIKVGTEVVLMDHATLTIIAKTITDQYGGYMFCNLDPNKTDYMLFTIDNDGVTPKNALIKDYVQPVTSNNGTVAGNFPGVLEAMAPVMSGIPLRRSGEGGVANGMRLARPSGNCVGSGYELDWNGWQTWTDLTDSPPASACPLPNNNKVRGIKHTAGWSGWKNRPTRAALFGADRGKSFYQPAINTPEGQGYLTILCSHYTDGAAMTYSVCYEMRPDYSEQIYRAAHNADLFYPDNGEYYASDCFFNVCVEANGELRLKWLIDNNGVPNSASKRNVLVTTLTAGKWYFIAVRIGAVTDAIKIDVCDPYAGTIQTFTPGATLESLNKQQNYGSLWGNGTPRRNGFRISGAHNQAVNNTFNTWDSATCWTWQAFGTGNGTSGPWAWWNRVLTDAETQELLRSTYETSISMMPRGMAEVYKYCPSMYIPLDEYPTVLPWQTRKGHGVLFTPMQSALTKEYPAFSLRRRKPVQHGQGWKSAQMSIPHPNNFTVIAFFYQPTANGGGPVFNTPRCQRTQPSACACLSCRARSRAPEASARSTRSLRSSQRSDGVPPARRRTVAGASDVPHHCEPETSASRSVIALECRSPPDRFQCLDVRDILWAARGPLHLHQVIQARDADVVTGNVHVDSIASEVLEGDGGGGQQVNLESRIAGVVHRESDQVTVTDPCLPGGGLGEVGRADRESGNKSLLGEDVHRRAYVGARQVQGKVKVDSEAGVPVEHDGDTTDDDVFDPGRAQSVEDLEEPPHVPQPRTAFSRARPAKTIRALSADRTHGIPWGGDRSRWRPGRRHREGATGRAVPVLGA